MHEIDPGTAMSHTANSMFADALGTIRACLLLSWGFTLIGGTFSDSPAKSWYINLSDVWLLLLNAEQWAARITRLMRTCDDSLRWSINKWIKREVFCVSGWTINATAPKPYLTCRYFYHIMQKKYFRNRRREVKIAIFISGNSAQYQLLKS